MIDYLKKFSLKGKVVFITGAAGLIGAEISKALAGAGAKTIILDVDKKKGMKLEKTIRKAGYKAYYEYFNIADLEAIEENINRLVKKYKSLYTWVNSAYPRTKDWADSVEELKLISLQENVNTQMNSYLWTSRCAAVVMKKLAIKGSIINLGSIYGVQANDFTIYKGTKMTAPMAYSAIKGGVVNSSRYLASYFGEYGIRVNVVCPGGIFDNQNKAFVNNYSRKVPLKRMGRPQEVASVVLFLISEAASYINGETVMVDGGWTAV